MTPSFKSISGNFAAVITPDQVINLFKHSCRQHLGPSNYASKNNVSHLRKMHFHNITDDCDTIHPIWSGKETAFYIPHIYTNSIYF